jgi:hypothetical protein
MHLADLPCTHGHAVDVGMIVSRHLAAVHLQQNLCQAVGLSHRLAAAEQRAYSKQQFLAALCYVQ